MSESVQFNFESYWIRKNVLIFHQVQVHASFFFIGTNLLVLENILSNPVKVPRIEQAFNFSLMKFFKMMDNWHAIGTRLKFLKTSWISRFYAFFYIEFLCWNNLLWKFWKKKSKLHREIKFFLNSETSS